MKDAQHKKQMEEMAKLQEQKRKEAEREQIRKYVPFKLILNSRSPHNFLANIYDIAFINLIREQMARKERDNMKILAEQKALHEKLRANQRAADMLKQQRNQIGGYTFDMLESGDSTDCEDKETRKRPPPPEWSLKHNRMPLIAEEAKIDSKIIDKFFSVEPREVDLREIFPKIDDKYLRRNSSAIWRTPPRYSTMPKY